MARMLNNKKTFIIKRGVETKNAFLVSKQGSLRGGEEEEGEERKEKKRKEKIKPRYKCLTLVWNYECLNGILKFM